MGTHEHFGELDARIRQALDYDNTAAPTDGQAILWVASGGKFAPRTVVLPSDARLSDTRTPVDGSVTDAKVASNAGIAESKLALASDAVAGTASRRTLGTGARQAAAGNDPRLSDSRPDTAVRAALLGDADNTMPIVCETRLTTAYNNLPAGDYLMSGNMSVVTDRYSMWSLVSGNGYRATAPVSGRYDIDWHFVSSQGTGLAAAKIAHNAPNGSSVGARVTGYSLLSDVQTTSGSGEGYHVHVRGSEVLAAGDFLNLLIYSNVTFSTPVTTFGKIRTKFVMRYVGPE